MYCSNCGSQVPDGVAFCSDCGFRVAGSTQEQMQQFQRQKNVVRQSEIEVLENAISYFGQKRVLYNKYDCVSDRLAHYSQGAKKSLLIWGILIAVMGTITMLMYPEAAIITFFILPGNVMIVGGIFMQVNNKRKYAYFFDEYIRIFDELMEHYRAYPNCPVGVEYSDPKILESVLAVLNSGRADTMKEGINLVISEQRELKRKQPGRP